MENQFVTVVIAILGAGFAAYVGVRVGLAEDRTRINVLDKRADQLEDRIDRLERPYFDRIGGG